MNTTKEIATIAKEPEHSGGEISGIKLAPLDGFTRILVPYNGSENQQHIQAINVGKIISKSDIYYKRIDQQTVTKQLINMLNRKWNKYLYDTLKSRISKLELPKKAGNAFIQIGHKKVYGGLNVWIIKEPTLLQIDRGDSLECIAQVTFLIIINDKEIYEVC